MNARPAELRPVPSMEIAVPRPPRVPTVRIPSASVVPRACQGSPCDGVPPDLRDPHVAPDRIPSVRGEFIPRWMERPRSVGVAHTMGSIPRHRGTSGEKTIRKCSASRGRLASKVRRRFRTGSRSGAERARVVLVEPLRDRGEGAGRGLSRKG